MEEFLGYFFAAVAIIWVLSWIFTTFWKPILIIVLLITIFFLAKILIKQHRKLKDKKLAADKTKRQEYAKKLSDEIQAFNTTYSLDIQPFLTALARTHSQGETRNYLSTYRSYCSFSDSLEIKCNDYNQEAEEYNIAQRAAIHSR